MTTSHTPEHEHGSSAPDPHAAAPAPHDDRTSTSNSGRRALLAGLGGLAAGAMFASRAHAGPLDPPAGPITSTGKTLTDIEPRIAVNATNTPGDATYTFIISQPGSYYLAGNVTGNAGKGGISIEASNVTLDLNGFGVIGVAGAGVGVLIGPERSHIIIRNGSVTNWPGDGVFINDLLTATNFRIENIIVADNGGEGIFVGHNAVISGCISRNNGANGFRSNRAASVHNCLAQANGTAGFLLGNGCTLANCASRANGGNGFELGFAASVEACSAYENLGTGLSVNVGSVLSHCVAAFNSQHGMLMAARCTASACSASSNVFNGIVARSNSVVRQCICALNGSMAGQAGLRVEGNDSRIEDNTCTFNSGGYVVINAGNFISRNIASGNASPQWSVVAGNACLVVAAASSAAVSGNSGGTAPGSTDPNANFTF